MKFKSKSLISIILSIMMVISMILVAIPANAAVIKSVPVGAGASNGIIPAGESLYYDFTAVGSGGVNYCGGGNNGWDWHDEKYDVSTGIIEIKLTSDMNFNVNASGRNNILCKTEKGGWKELLTTIPGNGQNMVVVASDGKSYTWDTYSGSSTDPTVDPTEPTTTEPVETTVPPTTAPFTPTTPVSTVTDENGTAKTSFEVGESFLINVKKVEDGVTYSVYHGATNVGENVENGKIKVLATEAMIGEQTFTVKATYGDKEVTYNVTVTVTASSAVKTIKIYFKTATAPAYAPSVSFDGGNVTAMTKFSELGKDYSGALTFAWYSVEIQNVDKTKTYTLTFTSKRTKLNATWNGTLTKDSYFTADNLMNGTVAVNLTDKGVAERNFFYSATNMVYDSTDAKNKTLGFTFVGNARVKMGTVVNVSNGTVTPVSAPTVKSATYIQMINASMITVSSLQSELYDVNFDGKVDIKDATYIQYALAS